MFNSLKYGYSNARVMAMKSNLISKEELERYIEYDMYSLIDQLRKTHYKDYITHFSLKYHGSKLIQIITAHHFVDVYNKIRRICPDSDKEIIDIFMLKWGILNLKIAINAKISGLNYEEIDPFILPLKVADKEKIKHILYYDVSHFMRSLFLFPIVKELLKYKILSLPDLERIAHTHSLSSLIKFRNILDNAKNSIYDYVSKKIKVSKLKRIEQYSEEIENILLAINGNKVSKKYAFLTRMSKQEILDYVVKKEKLTNVNNFLDLEIQLYRKLESMKSSFFYRDYPSINVLLGFLFLKEKEVNNLKRIAIAKEFNLTKQETLKLIS